MLSSYYDPQIDTISFLHCIIQGNTLFWRVLIFGKIFLFACPHSLGLILPFENNLIIISFCDFFLDIYRFYHTSKVSYLFSIKHTLLVSSSFLLHVIHFLEYTLKTCLEKPSTHVLPIQNKVVLSPLQFRFHVLNNTS